eukprot:scaffold29082_cov40-Tisochrysis_lutea.AAC.2
MSTIVKMIGSWSARRSSPLLPSRPAVWAMYSMDTPMLPKRQRADDAPKLNARESALSARAWPYQ